MVDRTIEHRGADLIGEKVSEVEKLAHFRKKLTKVDKALEDFDAYSSIYAIAKEGVLKGEPEYEVELKAARDNEEVLYTEAFVGEDAHGSATEWIDAVIKRESLERKMIEKSNHVDSSEVRRVEALKEYRSYLDEKIEELSKKLEA